MSEFTKERLERTAKVGRSFGDEIAVPGNEAADLAAFALTMLDQNEALLRDKIQLGEERAAEWKRAENAEAERDRLMVELEQRRSVMSRLPFCPDHRDKVAGLECRECEVERIKKELEEAGKAILWMHEMYPTKALRNNEWSKAVRRALERGK